MIKCSGSTGGGLWKDLKDRATDFPEEPVIRYEKKESRRTPRYLGLNDKEWSFYQPRWGKL